MILVNDALGHSLDEANTGYVAGMSQKAMPFGLTDILVAALLQSPCFRTRTQPQRAVLLLVLDRNHFSSTSTSTIPLSTT